MYILRPDEKKTPVMIYAQDTFVRGEVVNKQSDIHMNIWLRTDGVPKYLHILNAQVLVVGGSPIKAIAYEQLYFPSSQLIGFHTLPPVEEPLDYDQAEANRTTEVVEVLVGTFIMKGKIRISAQTEIGTSLEVARASWISIYEAWITNPYLPQMPAMHVPMVLVNPNHVAFGVT